MSPTGQPYLVLEHVDGEHIDATATRTALDVEARVRLFLDVLAAVAHAHANLIVHRDLKPSNVLVTATGRSSCSTSASPSCSRATPSRRADADARRRRRAHPEYAAPEQLTGGAVTTATDVYALGVLLYVLLGGPHPAAGPSTPAEGSSRRSSRPSLPRLVVTSRPNGQALFAATSTTSWPRR